jgi:SAM-dependent methyltransferase
VKDTRIDFDRWAGTYDATRGASPSVLRPLLEALALAAERSLLDIGGGTGNFAAALSVAGFRTMHSDLSLAMASAAAAKHFGPVCVADAQHLPFADATIDCAVSVNVARHIPDRPRAFAEARRVIRDGPFVVKVSTAETQRGDWVVEYFPRLLEHQPSYQPEALLAEELRGAGFTSVEVRRFIYEDALDGSFQALKRFPDRLLDAGTAANTAVFQRLPEAELEAGFKRLRADHASGALRDVMARYEPASQLYGDGSIFIART